MSGDSTGPSTATKLIPEALGTFLLVFGSIRTALFASDFGTGANGTSLGVGFVGVALAQYEASRACWWELMARCGLPVERTEPVATATAEDVMRLAAELLRTIPGARYDCGGCRSCTDAKGVEKGAHSYALAVRFVWCTLTGRPEW